MTFVVGIDVGGTFTDGVAIDLETGSITVAKFPTTNADPLEGVMAVVDELAMAHSLDRSAILSGTERFVHGTTLTSNVALERRGAGVGLITTQGFGDAILMMSGKGRVAGLSLMERRHFRRTDKPDPIVPGAHIVEVSERVDLDGDVVVPLTDTEIEGACQRIAEMGVDACAIALLWSFRNTVHENRLAEALRERMPDLFVSTSSELAPLMGEYERTATAVMNAYVGPAVTNYLDTVESELRRAGLRVPLLIVQSSGGVAEASETQPVNTIESGPAAGVSGSTHLMSQIGEQHAIVTDVGGTTFKVTLVRDRTPELTTETVLGQYSLLIPMIDVVSIGAGGGSIAWVDGERIRVGPQSAGSSPGPACYGWGGEEPTVTDADLVLGYLNPEFFLGGKMKLDGSAASRAIKSRIADPMFDGDIVRAAAAIREVMDMRMADLIRKVSLERGHDPREFVVLAYGGAGPVHCGTYAAELGCPRIVIPPNATAYSAFGAAVSHIRHSYSLSRQGPAPGDPGRIRDDLDELERRAREVLGREGVKDEAIEISAWADLRYKRQFFELRVPLPPPPSISPNQLEIAIERFEADYAKRYGRDARHGRDRIEYVRFGLDAEGPNLKSVLQPQLAANGDADQALKSARQVHWRETESMSPTPIYDGALLRHGHEICGPAVVEHVGTSIAIHEGQRAFIDEHGNTIIELQKEGNDARRPSHL